MSNLGLKPYTKQLEKQIGSSTGYVNLNKDDGNLIFNIPIISTTSVFPFDISLIYNYQNKDVTSTFGKGIKLNYNYEIVPIGNVQINVYNPDGTFDAFIPKTVNGNVFENSETKKTITRVIETIGTTNYSYLLTDKYGNVLEYSSSNLKLPYKITKSNNEIINISSTSSLITISNTNGDVVKANVGSNYINYEYTINSTNKVYKTVTNFDTNKNITSVQYYMFNSTTSSYKLINTLTTSFGTSQITMRNSQDNYYIKYVLSNYLVTSIRESTVDGYERVTLINYVNSYQTTVTNYDGEKYIYNFDYNGLPTTTISKNKKLVMGTIYNNDTKLIEQAFGPISFVDDESNLLYNENLIDFDSSGVSVSMSSVNQSDEVMSLVNKSMCVANGTGTLTFVLNENIIGSDVLTLSMCFKNLFTYSESKNVKVEAFVEGDRIIKHVFENTAVTNQYDILSISKPVLRNGSNITIKFTFLGGANIEIGNLMLYKKSFGSFYKYDENKNLIEADFGNVSNQASYNEYNKVENTTSSNSSSSNKEYNSNKLMSKSNEHYGVCIEKKYDSYNMLNEQTISSPYSTSKINQKQECTYGTSKTVSNYNLLQNQTFTDIYDIFNRIQSSRNVIENTITYYLYNENNGLLKQIQFKDENNTCTNYSYTYDSKNRIHTITCPNGLVYTFTYDNYSNLATVKLNEYNLESYEYDSTTNLVTKITFANGNSVEYEYNSDLTINKVINLSSSGTTINTYTYVYDSKKQLNQIKDSTNTIVLAIEYDCDGQVLKVVENGSEVNYKYDNLGHVNNESRIYNNKLIHQSFDTIDRSKGSNPENLDKYLKQQVDVLAATFIDDANIKCYGHEITPSYKDTNGNDISFSCVREGIIPYVSLSSSKRLNYKLNIIPQTEIVTGSVGFWFKVTASVTSKKYLFSYKSVTNSSYLGVYIQNNYLYLESIDNTGTSKSLCSSDYQIKINEWNFFALDIQNRHDSEGSNDTCQYILFLNSHFTTYTQSNPRLKVYLDSAPYYYIGSKYNGSSYSYFFTGKIASLYIGVNKYLGANKVMEYYRMTKDYLIDNELIDTDVNGVDFGVGRYTNFPQEEISSYKIFPLHNTVESLSGDKPVFFKQRTLSNVDKDRTFNFDKTLKDYVFVSDGNKLHYSFNFDTMGTIIMKVLIDGTNDKQYLYELTDGTNKFGLYRNSDKKLCIIFNGTIHNSNIVINNDTWYNVSMTFTQYIPASSTDAYGLSYVLYVNNSKYENMFTTSVTIDQVTLSVGSSQSSISINEALLSYQTYYPLYGHISSMLIKEGSALSQTTINSLINKLTETKKISIYDELGFLKKTEIYDGNSNILSNTYEYKKSSNNSFLTINPSKETIKVNNNINTQRLYTTDEFGRITSVSDSLYGSHTYEYNSRGFLTKEDSTTYTYDTNGNILTKGNNTFTYTNGVLTKVNNTDVMYDENNTSYIKQIDCNVYSYKENKLSKYEVLMKGDVFNYTYNAQGLRTHKNIVINGGQAKDVYYKYSLNKLITEIRDNYRLDFLYDEKDMLYGFIYNNNTKYFYIRDVTGLILGITLQNGEVVVKYDYDAWGKKISITDTSEFDLGTKNPFRYKGYYYDEESSMYYLLSRYYVPEWGRWITPDNTEYLYLENINSLNLFSYCFNSPINYKDIDGCYPINVYIDTILSAFKDIIIMLATARKVGKTPNKRWPPLPDSLGGKKAGWNPDGYWEVGKKRYVWDDRSHGAGVDRGEGQQDGHWDEESTKNRYNRDGSPLPGNDTEKSPSKSYGSGGIVYGYESAYSQQDNNNLGVICLGGILLTVAICCYDSYVNGGERFA